MRNHSGVTRAPAGRRGGNPIPGSPKFRLRTALATRGRGEGQSRGPRSPLGLFPLQGLGLTSLAPGRTLVCARKQTHRMDPTICSHERGEERNTNKSGYKNHKNSDIRPTEPSHITLFLSHCFIVFVMHSVKLAPLEH